MTCRPAETGLPGIKELALAGLARPDSLHLLAAVLDLKGIAVDRPDKRREGYERHEIDALLRDLQDHPLSIELVAPHLKALTPAKIRAEFGQLVARFADDAAYEGRNRSLLASLEFSKRRLSAAAQAALPALAWFEGGVFEAFLLTFSQIEPEAWAAIRAELVATALINVEELEQFNTPYLRFHPTLPYAARPTDVHDPEAAEQRFIGVYLGVGQIAYNALFGRQPAAGMALLAREEANMRPAIRRAFARGDRQAGWGMADTLRLYLERAGRLRERDTLVAWVRGHMPKGGGLDEAACGAIRQHAWSRFTQGHAAEAIQTVHTLIARLESEGLAGGEDARFQIALGYRTLGQIYVHARRPDLALEPARRAIALFEPLPGDDTRGNLSSTLGDLANAYHQLGRFDTALDTAERALAIERELGQEREIATSLGTIAQVLKSQQRYTEADARYTEALRAAQAAGDIGLQGLIFQHQGSLQDDIGNYDRAIELYKQAIALFQRANNISEEMRTCDLLATAERQKGQLDAAAAWYARSRELALQLKDQHQLGIVAQNVGILYRTRAERSPDSTTRAALLRQAVASVGQGLTIRLDMQDQVGAAQSYNQLADLHCMLVEFDQAQEYALQALIIRESLNLPDIYKVYGNLAAIARDRGDAEAATQWQAKHDAKLAELEHLRRGEGAGEPSSEQANQLTQFILALAQAAYDARTAGAPLPPDATEALAQLAEAAPPLDAVAAFLRAIAAGEPVPAVPQGLPPGVVEVLERLVRAVGPGDQ